MPGFNDLYKNLDKLKKTYPATFKRGMEQHARRVVDSMRSTNAHGVVTGATKASYSVRVVGLGDDGSAAHHESVAAVEELNPAHTATSTVTIDGAIGVIIDSATDYQWELETKYAGRTAVLAPTLQGEASNFIAAGAAECRKGR
jgi:hypothetical protein